MLALAGRAALTAFAALWIPAFGGMTGLGSGDGGRKLAGRAR